MALYEAIAIYQSDVKVVSFFFLFSLTLDVEVFLLKKGIKGSARIYKNQGYSNFELDISVVVDSYCVDTAEIFMFSSVQMVSNWLPCEEKRSKSEGECR